MVYQWKYQLYQLLPKVSAVDIGMGSAPNEFTLKKIGGAAAAEERAVANIPIGAKHTHVVLKEYTLVDEDDN